jgi:hypothetical protein
MSNTERLFVVLNEQFVPPKEFNQKRLEIAIPEAVDEHGRNTRLTVSGIPGRGYFGDVDVYYDRGDIAGSVIDFTFRSDVPLTHDNIVKAMAVKCDIEINPEDIDAFDQIPLTEGQTQTVILTVAETSVQWYGLVEITVEYGKQWLDTVTGVTDLDVLQHPSRDATRQSARVAMWGMDFSGLYPALKPTAKGAYSDWAAVQTLTRKLGIRDWMQGTVVDMATADVPDANPLFERVVIQSSVVSGLLVGPVYFHYNPS